MDFTKVKEFMDFMAAERTPANAIAIYIDNKPVYSYASGYSDLENKTPLTGDEMFYIYSCSKPATVIGALQLVEQGKLSLDDPLYKYIPEFKDMYIKDDNGEIKKATNTITIKHLFTMTSGLSYNFEEKAFEKARNLTDGHFDTLTTIKCLAEAPLWYNPGEGWMYSLAHDVLGAVIEVVTGKKFADYMQENIFAPLEINATYDFNKAKDKMAELYGFIPDTGAEKDIVSAQQSGDAEKGTFRNEHKINGLAYGDRYESGGAGVITTVGDYAKFASALANDGVGPNGARIIMPETIKLMCENHFPYGDLSKNSWEHLSGYGYGLGVRIHMDKEKSGSLSNLGEFGWCGAAGATLIADPKARLGVFYAQHTLNPRESYYFPRLRNVIYECLK